MQLYRYNTAAKADVLPEGAEGKAASGNEKAHHSFTGMLANTENSFL